MKNIKLFAVALGMFAMVSCSDSKDVNTAANVTVEMGQSEVTVKEHVGRFLVPVKVTGEPNGPVKIRIKVEGSGNNPAAPFEESNGQWSGNYIVTSKEISIPADEKTADIEIYTVDDKIQNEDRAFLVTIESADGAAIGTAASTLVILKDNDSVPYERVQGEWTLSFYDYDNVPQSMNVNITGYDEDSKKYGVELSLNGLYADYSTGETAAQVYFYDDEADDMRYMEIEIPQIIGTYGGDTSYSLWLITAQRQAGGSISMTLNNIILTGIVSDDYETITFDEGIGFAGYVASSSFDSQLGGIDAATDIVMTKR